MPHVITQCYLPPGRGDTPVLTPAEAGTLLPYRGRGGTVTKRAERVSEILSEAVKQAVGSVIEWSERRAGNHGSGTTPTVVIVTVSTERQRSQHRLGKHHLAYTTPHTSHYETIRPKKTSQLTTRHETGSLGHWVNGPFGSSFTSGSPGHHFDPV